MACLEILRWKRTASSLFFIVANAATKRTAMVTVFIPPAVPTGEPPININNMEIKAEAFVRFCWGTVANPAVLVVTD